MPEAGQVPISFHTLHPFQLREKRRLKHFLFQQIQGEGKSIEAIHYIFCSDNYLLELNQRHLNHDTYTDIITFQLSEPSDPIVADIYVSIERVRENASDFQTSFSQELMRVIFHGALHLCGFKDKSRKEQKEMRRKEEEWMTRFLIDKGST